MKSLICLTEEYVETLYLLGKEDLIKGVSVFVKRPEEATLLPKVSSYLKGNYKKIIDIKADLVLGFSDIQKDMAKELVSRGQNVLVTNQRSISEILDWIYRLSLLVDSKEKGLKLISRLEKKIEGARSRASQLKWKPKIYFEEWDEPMITAIEWVSEIIILCGGENIFEELSFEKMANGRFVSSDEVVKKNPDIIFGCWCGKKVDIDSIYRRKNWREISAIKNNRVFELEPEIFLQPGPAPILEGLDQILTIFEKYQP